MPAGKTHDLITLWSLPCIVGFSYLLTRDGELTLMVAGAFLFSGLLFGPDLDIYSIQFKRWGKLRSIWLPYRSLFRHRSLFSHGFIIGTTLRLVYLLMILGAIAIFAVAVGQLIWGFNWNWQHFTSKAVNWIFKERFPQAIALFIGLELGSMSHSLADWIGSAVRKKRKRQKKKG
jgi:uncharacterized metal-binding protein